MMGGLRNSRKHFQCEFKMLKERETHLQGAQLSIVFRGKTYDCLSNKSTLQIKDGLQRLKKAMFLLRKKFKDPQLPKHPSPGRALRTTEISPQLFIDKFKNQEKTLICLLTN